MSVTDESAIRHESELPAESTATTENAADAIPHHEQRPPKWRRVFRTVAEWALDGVLNRGYQ